MIVMAKMAISITYTPPFMLYIPFISFVKNGQSNIFVINNDTHETDAKKEKRSAPLI